ncbi:uncharacterized protein LOC126598762 [Malus sylvestris]|uniref:uncharacterized protein LOC126598762 n=1 Tax=Malus sylvestris TaxID=3752 RepID=UPI0021AC4618|nr:uncharacterized protein LOC126598762 [Malus sylvestris]
MSLLSLPSTLSPLSPSLSLLPASFLSLFLTGKQTVKLYLHNPLPILFLILKLVSTNSWPNFFNFKSKKRMILFGFYVFFKYGSGVLDGQERISSGVDECDEVEAGDEVDRAGGYDGIVGFLTL